MVIAGRCKWPIYESIADDILFRNRSWDTPVDPVTGPRPVQHDNTNFPLKRPSDAALQHALYSAYYAMCCAKGLRWLFSYAVGSMA